MKTKKQQNIFQIKVTLKDFKPSTYRTLLVSEEDSFLDLHTYIQEAFGLCDYHLWHFTKENIRHDRLLEVIFPYEEFESSAQETKDPKKTKLKEIFIEKGFEKLNYQYDFGDSWEFSVELQKIISEEDADTFPRVIKVKGGMILEDCGGTGGLEDLISDFKKKKFDPGLFDDWDEFEEYIECAIQEVSPEEIILTK